jgi:hypothetical protein
MYSNQELSDLHSMYGLADGIAVVVICTKKVTKTKSADKKTL